MDVAIGRLSVVQTHHARVRAIPILLAASREEGEKTSDLVVFLNPISKVVEEHNSAGERDERVGLGSG